MLWFILMLREAMKLIRNVVGEFGTNAYFVIDNNEAILIDPGSEPETLIKTIEKNKLNVVLYLLTHSHYDHFGALEPLLRIFKAPVAIHHLDSRGLVNPSANLSLMLGKPTAIKADLLLKDEQELELIGQKFKLIHTPGHTPGSISILVKNYLFSGDTLFNGGIGRTDLPGGAHNDLRKSLEKLFMLPDDTIVLPGHGESTTIGKEKLSLIY